MSDTLKPWYAQQLVAVRCLSDLHDLPHTCYVTTQFAPVAFDQPALSFSSHYFFYAWDLNLVSL